MAMTFVGVCGGRDYKDANRVHDVLRIHVGVDDVVVHGGAPGADTMAGAWARAFSRHELPIRALWDHLGRSAGVRRNAVIAALPLRLLIAFPGGRGTADMVAKARAKGIEVLEIT